MSAIINGDSPSVTFSDGTTQSTAGLTSATGLTKISPTVSSGALTLSSTGLAFSDATTQTSAIGVSKSWVKFNGTAATVTASFNVSSITKVGTGDYRVNFTNAFANTNYSVSGMAGAGTTGYSFLSTHNSTYQTTYVEVYNCIHNGSLQDGTEISVQIHSA